MMHFLPFFICFLVTASSESIAEPPSSDKTVLFQRMKIPAELITGITNQLVNLTSSNLVANQNVQDRQYYDSVCGKGNPSSKEIRILGGSETGTHEFPWQAFLVMVLQDGSGQTCGGSLISDRWILTAASCVYQAKQMAAILGAHDISDILAGSNILETGSRQVYVIQYLQVHPDWLADPNKVFQADLALVQLPTSVPFSDYIRPVYLPGSVDTNDVNDPVTLTGWGYPDGGASQQSSKLLKASTNIISKSVCVNAFRNLVINGNSISIAITDDMICSSGDNNHGTCFGDGGGPMNYQNQDGTWTQIGITSFLYPGCVAGKPDGFTRVHSFIYWINQVTGGNYCARSASTTTISPQSSVSSSITTTALITTRSYTTISQHTSVSSSIHFVQHYFVAFLTFFIVIFSWLCGSF